MTQLAEIPCREMVAKGKEAKVKCDGRKAGDETFVEQGRRLGENSAQAFLACANTFPILVPTSNSIKKQNLIARLPVTPTSATAGQKGTGFLNTFWRSPHGISRSFYNLANSLKVQSSKYSRPGFVS